MNAASMVCAKRPSWPFRTFHLDSPERRVNPKSPSPSAQPRQHYVPLRSVQRLGVLRELRRGRERVADLVQRLDWQGLRKRLGCLFSQPG